MLMRAALRRFNAEIFQALSHPTRIAILEVLREGEISGRDLAERLGAETTNLPQHLGVLRQKKIIVSRRDGYNVAYTVHDPMIFQLLDVVCYYFQAHMAEAIDIFQEIAKQ